MLPGEGPAFEKMIGSIERALAKRITPRRLSQGTSGLYQLRDISRNVVALFKPIDEEPVLEEYAKPERKILRKFSNEQSVRARCRRPPGHAKQVSLRKGIYSGELAQREVFAYLLDAAGLHGVPPTTLVEIDGQCFGLSQDCLGDLPPKLGSIQKY